MDQIVQFVTNHWQLCIALIVIALLILINEFISQRKQGKAISAQESIDLINHQKAIVCDLRSVELYNKGHIINSICASEADFAKPKLEKYKQKPIILVCSKGIQAAALSTKLRKSGFSQVFVLAGGISNWQTENLPVVKGK